MATIAIYAGSFDPITRGHEDLIQRSCEFVDKLVVAVARNSSKKPLFTADERVDLISEVTRGNDCVDVHQFEGLAGEFRAERQRFAHHSRPAGDERLRVRVPDGAHEPSPLAGLETVFMIPSVETTYISSSIVREIAQSTAAHSTGWCIRPSPKR